MCNCYEQINEELKPHNTRLSPMILLGKDRKSKAIPAIATEKLDSHKRPGPVHLGATYCPFCGEKLVEDEVQE